MKPSQGGFMLHVGSQHGNCPGQETPLVNPSFKCEVPKIRAGFAP